MPDVTQYHQVQVQLQGYPLLVIPIIQVLARESTYGTYYLYS